LETTKRPFVSSEGKLIRIRLPVALLVLVPALASAQGGGLPTLSGAGIEYVSPSGLLQVTLSGQLDIESLLVGEDRWAGLVGPPGGDSVPSDWMAACADCHRTEAVKQEGKGGHVRAHRLRLFADLFLGDHVYSLVEVRSDRGAAPGEGSVQTRLEQAYIRVSAAGGRFGAQAGRFASPFGAYPLRHLTPLDPFVRPPLAYDYRTVMHPSLPPRDAEDFLRWKNWPELFRLVGAPPVWDVPYQWGAMIFGRVGPLDLRVAAMNGAPSTDPEGWAFDAMRLRRPAWVLGARTKAASSLEIGASYSRGPWMRELTDGAISPPAGAPPGTPSSSFRDFDQEIASADLVFARGSFVARAEVMLDFWEVPNLGERPRELAYALEFQTDLAAGFSGAVRWGYLDFRSVATGSGARQDWDHDVQRVEASTGYRLFRNAGILVSAYRQWASEGGGTTSLTGLRLWWAF
jgi:hypothetical protein